MTEPRPPESWSLRGKMLRSLGVTTAIVSLALSAAGVWFVREAANREVDALLHEELDEIRASFALVEPTADALEQVMQELHESHPGASFAWRVWQPGGEQLLGEFGDRAALLADAPALAPLDENLETGHGYRWRSTQLRSGHTVGLMLDEEPHFELVRQFGYIALLFLFIGFAGIALVGITFTNRVSTLLARVANEARRISAPSDEVRISRAELPEEVSDVVEALDEMLSKIRQEQRESRLLIAGVAHELRAPLQNLIGEAEVSLLAERSVERYREVLESQLDELRDLGDAIQNLVALCSAKRAAAAEVLEAFDLGDELRIRLGREMKRAARDGLQLTLDTHGDVTLVGDREALMTGLRNIISNALDWTPRGGRVQVTCDGEGSELVVTVRDSGPGIPEELVASLFEPFVRGAAAEGRRIGYGLGLALANSSAQAQGGAVEVAERDRPGACFRVVLPRRRPGG